MRSWKSTSVGFKLSLGATIILVSAIVWVLVEPRFDRPDPAGSVTAREAGDTKPGDGATSASKSLELGTVAKISANYRIAVTEVARYKIPRGQLIVPTIKATYIGTEDGEPWADLTVEYAGSGSKTFGESDCPAGLGTTDATEQPTWEYGDDETHEVCIELPTKDLRGGKISVEEAFSTDDRTFWSVKGAVTKTLPSVAPEPPAAQGPAARSQPRRQPANAGISSEACEDFEEDEYEDYKEWGESLKDQFEAYRDAGGDDEDRIDDFEEWEEEYDQMIDYYEKWDKACS